MENNIQNFIENLIAAAEKAAEQPIRENRALLRELNKVNSDGYLPDMLYDTVYEIVDFLDGIDHYSAGNANA